MVTIDRPSGRLRIRIVPEAGLLVAAVVFLLVPLFFAFGVSTGTRLVCVASSCEARMDYPLRVARTELGPPAGVLGARVVRGAKGARSVVIATTRGDIHLAGVDSRADAFAGDISRWIAGGRAVPFVTVQRTHWAVVALLGVLGLLSVLIASRNFARWHLVVGGGRAVLDHYRLFVFRTRHTAPLPLHAEVGPWRFSQARNGQSRHSVSVHLPTGAVVTVAGGISFEDASRVVTLLRDDARR